MEPQHPSIAHPPRAGRGPARMSRLRPAALVDVSAWGRAHSEERQIMRAHAVQALARGRVVASHTTAAAVGWNLPLVGVSDGCVHTTSGVEHPPKTRGDIIRHGVALPEADICERNGLLVTTLDRTVADVIRMLRPEAGLAVFDAALRLVAWDDALHTVRREDEERLRAAVRERIVAAAGGRGVRNARLVLELADGRAQLPGESISRFRMWELNLPVPDLQRRVVTSRGVAYLDMAWPDLRRFAEFDGEVKLFNPEFTRGRTIQEILADQAERRAAVEEATGWVGMQLGWAEAWDAATLWSSMQAQGWPSHARL